MMKGTKLNYGCGYDLRAEEEGWMNVDKDTPWDHWCKHDRYEEMYLGHVIEHFVDPLGEMSILWEVAKDACVMKVASPYGSSDDAWENPHHVRPYYPGTFETFGQAYWWRDKDAGYEADWYCEDVTLLIEKQVMDLIGRGIRDREELDREVVSTVQHMRNVVREMQATLRAIKPARKFEKGVKPGAMHWGMTKHLRYVSVDPETGKESWPERLWKMVGVKE